MRDGNPSAAADKYRTALSYDRENDIYRLRLAQALLASDRLNEARAHLLSLWDEEPADGEVNLDLARLYAKRNEPTQAVRYYRNAINGAWTDASQQRRIATRFDLIQYLLQRHDTGQASAELLALQADQPPDLSDRLRLAGLLLEVGEAARAIDVYNKVLKDNPDNLEAGLGLGTASFKLGDYQQAERAFSTVVEQDPTSTEAHKHLDLVREVLRVALSLRGLSLAERTRQTAQAFDVATNRLTECATQKGHTLSPKGAAAASTPDNLQLLYSRGMQMKAGATERALRRNPDSLELVMQFVFQVERATAPVCSDMGLTDLALLVLAQHESETLR